VIFGETPLDQAEAAILAHSLRRGAINFKKGRVLSAEDVARLAAAGVERVVAARLEPGDVHEDEAAGALAAALTGDHLTASAAFTGRCNLLVRTRGLLLVDHGRLDQLNLVDEAVTVATLPPFQPVEPRQMAATIKIIPFAVPGTVLERCLVIARRGGPLVRARPFRRRQVGLVQTHLPGMKQSLLDKTKEAVDGRLAALDCAPALERRCAHDSEAVAEAITELEAESCDILLVSGASAIVDRRDVVPAAIVAAGGAIDHFGMPVDPGNLILLGRVAERPVIGLPGCARSPKLNGFDWVLQRLVADLPIAKEDVMRMGAGGLLKEIASRPLPRARAVEAAEPAPASAPRIAALVLAAGRSTRMGAANKLLAQVDGAAMIKRVVAAVRQSQANPIIVVTGHQRAKVEAALADQEVTLVHNPDFAHGLSTSLHRGLGAVPAALDGVVVCLGDMPRIGAPVIDKLIAAFDPLEGRAICLPTWQGKRGNPVLLARRFFAEMQAISGDVGARALIGDYPELVAEVPVPEDSVLFDVDTPEALASLKPAS
jgi:molybdenum cofactor cytidylyltransferase